MWCLRVFVCLWLNDLCSSCVVKFDRVANVLKMLLSPIIWRIQRFCASV